jgi:periplasmic divalent cation tolerance protein
MIIIQTNTDTRKEAETIAKLLLKDKLAFLVHINQVRSFYLWKGNLIEGKEFVLNIKTLEVNSKKVIKMINEEHSYEIPPIISIPVKETSVAYLNLMKDELLK